MQRYHLAKSARHRYSRLKQTLNNYGFKLESSIKQESALVLRPTGPGQIIITGRNQILLIGEAAGWISPSSAEGLSYAFTSDLFAYQSLNGGLVASAERYQKIARSLSRNISHKLIKSSFATSVGTSSFVTLNRV